MNRGQSFATGESGMAVHGLQQAMVSRRPTNLDSNIPFSVTSQVMSDSSISSTPSVSSSAPWETIAAESSYGHNHGMHMQAAAMASQPSQQQYSAVMFMGNQARGPEAYLGQPTQINSLAPTPGMAQPMQQQGGGQMQHQGRGQIQQQGRGQMQFDSTLNTYQTGNDGSYGDESTGGWTG